MWHWRKNMHAAIRAFAALATSTCVLITACAPDTAIAPNNTSTPRPSWSVNPGPGELAQHARLAVLTHALALALDDTVVRANLKRDLDQSRFREHKLLAARYLHGAEALRGHLAAELGGHDGDVDATLDGIRPLELYIPVPEHKLTWNGGRDLIVAAQLREGAPIIRISS